MKKAFRFLTVFAVLWTAGVLAFDFVCAKAIWGQLRSLGFKEAPGTITSSEVVAHDHSEGTSYRAEIRYTYTVEGRPLESDQVRFDQVGDSNPGWARHLVAENPVGLVRPIYYDPAKPAESVLIRGLDGQNLFLALFLTPFNAAMIALAVTLAQNWLAPPFAGGARIKIEAHEVRVWFDGCGPLLTALICFAGVAFVSILALGFRYGGSPPTSLACVVWVLMAVAAIAGYSGRRWKLAGAFPDLIIDSKHGTITVTGAGNAPAVIPLQKVRGVEVHERVVKTGDGDSHSLVPLLLVADGPGHDLGSWSIPGRAEAFAAWLREILSLPPAKQS